MVKRNITPPFTFTCFTDKRAGSNPEILCEDLPPLDVENMPVRTKGIWPKGRLWGPKLGNLSGPVLFLDLDLVIVGSLDPFFEVGGPDDVILSRNQTTPFERLGGDLSLPLPGRQACSVARRRSAPIRRAWLTSTQFEQRFVTRNAPGGATFFPRRWVLHFRQDCRWPFPLNYFLTPRLPADARVILFPRDFHPQFAVEGRFGLKGRAAPPLDHHLAHVRSGAEEEQVAVSLSAPLHPPNAVEWPTTGASSAPPAGALVTSLQRMAGKHNRLYSSRFLAAINRHILWIGTVCRASPATDG